MAQSANVLTPGNISAESELVVINDDQFIGDLKRLKELRSFLIQEAVGLSTDDSTSLSFGHLNLLKYGFNGRTPTEAEYYQVERLTQTLFSSLTEPLRRRFIMSEIPGWVSGLSISLAFVALASLVLAIITQDVALLRLPSSGANTLPFYLVWLMSLGAIGSVAFIGMNALSVQQDITFDLSNRRLMKLRIVLGALFALVLTLPFGFEGFIQFIGVISRRQIEGDVAQPKIGGPTQAMLLLLPFVLGFSTSLVIMVLNRLVDGVQSFFGRSAVSAQGPSQASATRQR